jgi:glycosyltransferase involved in cell wall biosynthesis
MVTAGIEPTVVCLRRRDGGVEEDVLAGGYDVRFLPADAAGRVRVLRHVIRGASPDLIHTTLVGSSLLGRVAAVRTRVPVLTSLVNQSYTPERQDDPHVNAGALRLVRTVDGWTARHLTAHFHAITHAVKRWAADDLRVPADRITVVERGRDARRLGEATPERRAAGRAVLGLSADAEAIISVGRQEYQKGHRYLIEAMPRVLADHPSAVLLLAGREGAETEALRQLVGSRELDGAVRFLGHRGDLADLLAASDLFVFPSLWEGLGGALLEAMALGLPIVASDIEPVREVVEDGRCAELVPVRSPERLAFAISGLLGDGERAHRLGTQGREIFLQRFTLERSTERMVALMRRVALAGGRNLDGLGVA